MNKKTSENEKENLYKIQSNSVDCGATMRYKRKRFGGGATGAEGIGKYLMTSS